MINLTDTFRANPLLRPALAIDLTDTFRANPRSQLWGRGRSLVPCQGV